MPADCMQMWIEKLLHLDGKFREDFVLRQPSATRCSKDLWHCTSPVIGAGRSVLRPWCPELIQAAPLRTRGA